MSGILADARGIIDVSSRSHGALEPVLESGEGTSLSEDLDVATVTLDLTFLMESSEVRVNKRSESVFTGDEDSLSTGEFTLGASEGFTSVGNVLGTNSHGDKDVTDVNTASLEEGLSVSVSHTGLESISTSAGKHLVDADNVPGMGSDSHVEGFLTALGSHVLVSGNTGGLKSLGGDLFLLTGNQMDTSGERFPAGFLHTTIEHTDLVVGYTSVESRLGVRLVLLVSVALSGSSSHIIFMF
jgi:hypothetical protein